MTPHVSNVEPSYLPHDGMPGTLVVVGHAPAVHHCRLVFNVWPGVIKARVMPWQRRQQQVLRPSPAPGVHCQRQAHYFPVAIRCSDEGAVATAGGGGMSCPSHVQKSCHVNQDCVYACVQGGSGTTNYCMSHDTLGFALA